MGHVIRTAEQTEAVESLRRFLADRLDPVFNKVYRDSFVPREKMAEVMRQLTAFGMVSGMVSEASGGLGLDGVSMIMLYEEVAACSLDLAIPVLINGCAALMLEQSAPAELRQHYLPGLLRGDLFASVAISEPGAGSNVLEITTRARRDGDDFIISGEKTWISNGAYADFLICACRTSDDPRKGLTHFLLDRHEHPYQVRDIHKIALNGQSTAQIFLDDVRVPSRNIIGKEGEALKSTLALFERSRVFVAAQGVGVARRALEAAIAYAQERRQHGKPIAGHQLISALLAQMATQLDAARLLTHRAAQMIDQTISAEMEAAMAKYFACEAAVTITRQALQIHGGAGVTTEMLVEKLARQAIILPIPEGTSQIQQLIIGRALTGISAF